MLLVDRKLCLICLCQGTCDHPYKNDFAVLACREFDQDPAKEGVDPTVQMEI